MEIDEEKGVEWGVKKEWWKQEEDVCHLAMPEGQSQTCEGNENVKKQCVQLMLPQDFG